MKGLKAFALRLSNPMAAVLVTAAILPLKKVEILSVIFLLFADKYVIIFM